MWEVVEGLGFWKQVQGIQDDGIRAVVSLFLVSCHWQLLVQHAYHPCHCLRPLLPLLSRPHADSGARRRVGRRTHDELEADGATALVRVAAVVVVLLTMLTVRAATGAGRR